MSNRIDRKSILGVSLMLVGCAFPHLQMGEGSGARGGEQPEGGSSASTSVGGASEARVNSGATASGGRFATGGTSVSLTSGGRTATGGITAVLGGSSVGAGGSSGTSGTVPSSGGTTGVCSANTDLIALITASECDCRYGGDANNALDNACGFQGSIYAYGDNGLDETPCTADDTLDERTCYAGAEYRYTPCADGSCCIRGTTSLYPPGNYGADVWGAGMGLFLGTDQTGDNSSPYPGPAKGLSVRTSGTLSGQTVYFRYLQTAADSEPPFRAMASGAIGTINLPFNGVSCDTSASSCLAPGQHPYVLQIDIEGGVVAGHFEFCIDSITPIL